MYKYSLVEFIRLFHEALEGEYSPDNKLVQIYDSLVRIVFNHIALGLAKSHRLVFALSLVKELFPEEITDQHL